MEEYFAAKRRALRPDGPGGCERRRRVRARGLPRELPGARTFDARADALDGIDLSCVARSTARTPSAPRWPRASSASGSEAIKRGIESLAGVPGPVRGDRRGTALRRDRRLRAHAGLARERPPRRERARRRPPHRRLRRRRRPRPRKRPADGPGRGRARRPRDPHHRQSALEDPAAIAAEVAAGAGARGRARPPQGDRAGARRRAARRRRRDRGPGRRARDRSSPAGRIPFDDRAGRARGAATSDPARAWR